MRAFCWARKGIQSFKVKASRHGGEAAEKNEEEDREDRSAGCYGKESVLQPGRGLQYETVFRQRDGLS